MSFFDEIKKENPSIDILNQYISMGYDVNSIDITDPNRKNLVLYVCKLKKQKSVKINLLRYLVCDNNASLSVCTIEKNNPLHFLMMYRNDIDLIEFVMCRSPGLINGKNKFGETPFHYFCKRYDKRSLQLIIEKYSQIIDFNSQNNFSQSPIDVAKEFQIDKTSISYLESLPQFYQKNQNTFNQNPYSQVNPVNPNTYSSPYNPIKEVNKKKKPKKYNNPQREKRKKDPPPQRTLFTSSSSKQKRISEVNEYDLICEMLVESLRLTNSSSFFLVKNYLDFNQKIFNDGSSNLRFYDFGGSGDKKVPYYSSPRLVDHVVFSISAEREDRLSKFVDESKKKFLHTMANIQNDLAQQTGKDNLLRVLEEFKKIIIDVSDFFGGLMDSKEKIKTYRENIQTAQINARSNVVNVGSLRFGSSRVRCLVLKLICDNVGIRCRLVRIFKKKKPYYFTMLDFNGNYFTVNLTSDIKFFDSTFINYFAINYFKQYHTEFLWPHTFELFDIKLVKMKVLNKEMKLLQKNSERKLYEVYIKTKSKLEQCIVREVLSKENEKLFREKLNLIRFINFENVLVPIAFFVDKSIYIVSKKMKYNLPSWLKKIKEDNKSLIKVVTFLFQFVKSIKFLHWNNLYHNNIKINNILINAYSQNELKINLKISDFSVDKRCTRDKDMEQFAAVFKEPQLKTILQNLSKKFGIPNKEFFKLLERCSTDNKPDIEEFSKNINKTLNLIKSKIENQNFYQLLKYENYFNRNKSKQDLRANENQEINEKVNDEENKGKDEEVKKYKRIIRKKSEIIAKYEDYFSSMFEKTKNINQEIRKRKRHDDDDDEEEIKQPQEKKRKVKVEN